MARKSLSLDTLLADTKPVEAQSPKVEPEARPATSAPRKPAYRSGKRAFTAWANEAAYDQLRHMAIDKRTTIQALLEEGMDLVFHKYGYGEIARSKGGNTASSQESNTALP